MPAGIVVPRRLITDSGPYNRMQAMRDRAMAMQTPLADPEQGMEVASPAPMRGGRPVTQPSGPDDVIDSIAEEIARQARSGNGFGPPPQGMVPAGPLGERAVAGAGGREGPLVAPGMIPGIQQAQRDAGGVDMGGLGDQVAAAENDWRAGAEERASLERQDTIDSLLNDIRMGQRESGYVGAEGRRGADKVSRAAQALSSIQGSGGSDYHTEQWYADRDAERKSREGIATDRLDVQNRGLDLRAENDAFNRALLRGKFTVQALDSRLDATQNRIEALNKALETAPRSERTGIIEEKARLEEDLDNYLGQKDRMVELPSDEEAESQPTVTVGNGDAVDAGAMVNPSLSTAATADEVRAAFDKIGRAKLKAMSKEARRKEVEKFLGKKIPEGL